MIPARQAVPGVPAPQAEAIIDLDAIAHNIRILREHAGNACLLYTSPSPRD